TPSSSTGPARSSTRAATSSASAGPPSTRSSSSATSTWTWCARCATTGSSTGTAAPTPTPPSPGRDRRPQPAKELCMSTTLISGGTVVSATGRGAADVLVDGERIVAVLAPGRRLLGTDLAASVDRVIDATGKYVIPGGIDAHTHMEMPFGGTQASATFETGTRAAAHGGTTTIVDFVVQRQGERVQDALAEWHERAGGNCAVDYGFHQIIGGVDDDSLAAMDSLIAEGVTSFK